MLSVANAEMLHQMVASNESRLVIFDFGGTLYDFTPVHVECFRKALEYYGSHVDSTLLGHTVAHSIRVGEDSFAIASRLAHQFSLNLHPHDLAVRKRVIVEEQIAATRLEEVPKGVIERLTVELVSVAIITRGMETSARSILANTWPQSQLPATIPLFGRSTISEVVDKHGLLRAALSHFGLPASRAMFVGDSTEDEEIGHRQLLTYFDVDRC